MKRVKYLLAVIVILAMTASLITCGNTTPEKVTVTFDTDGGSAIAAVEITKGETLKEPIAPVKEGFTFDGWYTDSEFTVKYDFSQKVVEDITLYAKWAETTSIEEPKGLTFEEIEQLAKSSTSADIRFNIHSKNNPAEEDYASYVDQYIGIRDNAVAVWANDQFGNYISGGTYFIHEGTLYSFRPNDLYYSIKEVVSTDAYEALKENKDSCRMQIELFWNAILSCKELFTEESDGLYTLAEEHYSALKEAFNSVVEGLSAIMYLDNVNLVITEEEVTLHFDNDNRSYVSFYNFNTTDSLISDEDRAEFERWLAGNQATGMPENLYNVNGFQKVPDIDKIATKDGKPVLSVDEVFEQANAATKKSISLENVNEDNEVVFASDEDKLTAISWLYNLSVWNYNRVSAAAWWLDSMVEVSAEEVSGIISGSFKAKVRSAYSDISAPNGRFNQINSGLMGITTSAGSITETMLALFGWQYQSIDYTAGGTKYSSSRNGDNKSLKWYSYKSEDKNYNTDIYKYIMGGNVEKWDEFNVDKESVSAVADEEAQKAQPWERQGVDGWATYIVEPQYLNADKSKVLYDKEADTYEVIFAFNEDDVDFAGAKSKEKIINDTDDYITLVDPVFETCDNNLFVSGKGLPTKWVKDEGLISRATEDEDIKVDPGIPMGTAKLGRASILGTNVFSYDTEVDANIAQLIALYAPDFFTAAGIEAPDNLKYKSIADYTPVVPQLEPKTEA